MSALGMQSWAVRSVIQVQGLHGLAHKNAKREMQTASLKHLMIHHDSIFRLASPSSCKHFKLGASSSAKAGSAGCLLRVAQFSGRAGP